MRIKIIENYCDGSGGNVYKKPPESNYRDNMNGFSAMAVEFSNNFLCHSIVNENVNM